MVLGPFEYILLFFAFWSTEAFFACLYNSNPIFLEKNGMELSNHIVEPILRNEDLMLKAFKKNVWFNFYISTFPCDVQ